MGTAFGGAYECYAHISSLKNFSSIPYHFPSSLPMFRLLSPVLCLFSRLFSHLMSSHFFFYFFLLSLLSCLSPRFPLFHLFSSHFFSLIWWVLIWLFFSSYSSSFLTCPFPLPFYISSLLSPLSSLLFSRLYSVLIPLSYFLFLFSLP